MLNLFSNLTFNATQSIPFLTLSIRVYAQDLMINMQNSYFHPQFSVQFPQNSVPSQTVSCNSQYFALHSSVDSPRSSVIIVAGDIYVHPMTATLYNAVLRPVSHVIVSVPRASWMCPTRLNFG